MKRLLSQLALAASLLVPGAALAQEKPVLNTAPPASVPVTPAPAVVPTPAPADTVTARPAAPASALPAPSYSSPSGLELPQRELERKAAQQHADQFSKMFIYTGLGLGYGSNYYSDGGVFSFSASPALGYRLNDRVSVGPGISYAFNNYSFGRGYPSINTNSVGVKVFGQVRVIDQFLIHAEYEVTRAEFLAVDNQGYLTGGTVKRQVQTPLAGIGYRSQFSPRAAADILLLYNFQDDYNSIYPNPVIRFNFLFNIGR